jgi:hypothetical protein
VREAQVYVLIDIRRDLHLDAEGRYASPIDTREKGPEDWPSEVTAGLINPLDTVEGWRAASSAWPYEDTERQRAAMLLRAQSRFIKISFSQIAGVLFID